MGYKHMTSPDQGAISENAVFTYDIDNLASQSPYTPSGMREDILLASWLVVLLRTREGERVSFDWKHQTSSNSPEATPNNLSMEDVMKGLEDSIANITKNISSRISRADTSKNHVEPVSVLLSTSVLSQESEISTVRQLSTIQCSLSLADLI